MQIFSQFLLKSNIPENLAAMIYDCYLINLFHKDTHYFYHGQHSILLFLNKDLKITKKSIDEAAHGGHNSTILFLLEHGAVISQYAISCAIENRHVETIKLLLAYGAVLKDDDPDDMIDDISWATGSGSIDTVKLLLSLGKKITDSSITQAAKGEHIHMLKFLLEYPGRPEICKYAIYNVVLGSNNIEIIKLLLEHNAEISEESMSTVIFHGFTNIAKIFLDYRYKVSKADIQEARRLGRHEILRLFGVEN